MIDADGPTRYPINGGRCLRIHDLARVEVTGPQARVVVSMARGTPYAMPLKLGMVERHPLGSQAFMPLLARSLPRDRSAPDENGRPGKPRAFLSAPGQGVNYLRNAWHGVLTPLGAERDFLIVDRAGEGNNLEEFAFDEPYEIHLPPGA